MNKNHNLISSTEYKKRSVFLNSNINNFISTQHGVNLELQYPVVPFVFFCGSKKKPSDLHISVKWIGEWNKPINSIKLSIILGKIKNPPIILTQEEIKLQNHIEAVLKLNSGYELRPVEFSVIIKVNYSQNMEDDYVIKQTNCVLMTAPSTQKKKAISGLAWKELEPFLENINLGSSNVNICHISQLNDLLQGRWYQLFENKAFPSDCTKLFSNLSKGSFFTVFLEVTRDVNSQLLHKLKEKEFRCIWSWFESIFTFIEDNASLYFNYNIPKIQGRIECEEDLKRFSNEKCFIIRFASEEGTIGISVYNAVRCFHANLQFKKAGDLLDYIKILENHKFIFYDNLLFQKQQQQQQQNHNNILSPSQSILLYPQLSNLSLFTKIKKKKSNYSQPTTIADFVAGDESCSLSPLNFTSWSPSEVSEWFRIKGVNQYKLFLSFRVEGNHLASTYLSEDRLIQMGFSTSDCNIITNELKTLQSTLVHNKYYKEQNNNINSSNTTTSNNTNNISFNFTSKVGEKRPRDVLYYSNSFQNSIPNNPLSLLFSDDNNTFIEDNYNTSEQNSNQSQSLFVSTGNTSSNNDMKQNSLFTGGIFSSNEETSSFLDKL